MQTFALPLGYGALKNGAVDEARTRDLHLGKVALYQLSYYRLLYRLSYQGIMATRRGLEPLTSSVTGWHSKPTELPGQMMGTTGLEPVTLCL